MRLSRFAPGLSTAALCAVALWLFTQNSNAEVYDAKPLIVLPTTPYDENQVRDRDIEFYAKRVAEDPTSALDRSALARLLFTRARVSGSTTDLDQAEQLVRESISDRSHRNYASFELLAALLMARHEFQAARTVALKLDSLNPETPSHRALLGEIELELGEYDSAASRFESIQYDGRNFTTVARIARWYELTGRAGRARTFLKRAINSVDRRDDLPREQAAWFHYRLGDLELRLGNIAAAESALVKALERNPDDARALGGLAKASLEREEYRNAVAYGERATATQLDPETLGIVSLAYAKLGDSAQAQSYARAMSVSAFEQPGAIHRAWGLFLLDHGTTAERTMVLERARSELRDRKDVYGHDLLAWALYRNGRIEEARAHMKQALSQNTQDVMLVTHARELGVR